MHEWKFGIFRKTSVIVQLKDRKLPKPSQPTPFKTETQSINYQLKIFIITFER